MSGMKGEGGGKCRYVTVLLKNKDIRRHKQEDLSVEGLTASHSRHINNDDDFLIHDNVSCLED